MKSIKIIVGAAILILAATVQTKSAAVGVAVSAINYTGDEMSYVATDPTNPSNAAAEVVGPFAAGGIICCYDLPKTWKTGIRIKVKFYDIKEKLIREISTDVLPYIDGKVEHLWIASYPDGSVEAISSQYLPTHEKWPGKVRGWPKADRVFLGKLWEEKITRINREISTLKSQKKELEKSPQKKMEEFWLLDQEFSKKSEKGIYHGPDDPAYVRHIKMENEMAIKSAKRERDELMERKP